jgi:hypothetical protein
MAKTQHFTNVQAGLPIYVLLLSGNNCTRQSALLLNQSKRKIKSGLLADLLALHKTEES